MALASVKSFPLFPSGLGPGTHTRENGKRKLCRRAKPLEKLGCLPALPLSPRRPEHSAQGTLSCCVEGMGEPCSSDLALSWGKKKYLDVYFGAESLTCGLSTVLSSCSTACSTVFSSCSTACRALIHLALARPSGE